MLERAVGADQWDLSEIACSCSERVLLVGLDGVASDLLRYEISSACLDATGEKGSRERVLLRSC